MIQRKKYIDKFNELLFPKVMIPIDIRSKTIQYKDNDGTVRPFSELSSGEKEVVILTFDILTQNPSDCLILIDEPEVHLHPELTFRLVKVLRSIGENNQFFLFTHSSDIIGNALDTGVHFIRPNNLVPHGNQVVRVDDNNLEDFKVIPNIRETIGMVSVGKKLLFVEGNNLSIDRNVFSTISKSSKLDLSIVPSDSCTNITNMSLMCNTLEKGLFGLELFMVRDRDGLTEEQIEQYVAKSGNKLKFLPYYHIENAFLHPRAIHEIAKKVLINNAPSADDIEKQIIEYARKQILYTASMYVKSEVYFKAGNFDVSPNLNFNEQFDSDYLISKIYETTQNRMKNYNEMFSRSFIDARIKHWISVLEDSLRLGWSEDSRRYFIGKRILKEISGKIFKNSHISLWEHIINSDENFCQEAVAPLREIIDSV